MRFFAAAAGLLLLLVALGNEEYRWRVASSAWDLGETVTSAATGIHKTTASLVNALGKYTFDDLYDVLFNKDTSDVRATVLDLKWTTGLAAGKCVLKDGFSGNTCSGSDPQWGHKAFNYVCAADTTYSWDDPLRLKTNIHNTMGIQCQNPTACQAKLCLKVDETANVRAGFAKLDLTGIDLGEGNQVGGPAGLYFNVKCGVRKKMMICPMKLQMKHCAVKKSCTGASNPTPRQVTTSNQCALYNYGPGDECISWASTLTTKPYWSKILALADVKSAMQQTCADHCGFY